MKLTTRCLLSTLALLASISMVSAHEQGSDNYTMPKDVLSNGGDKSNSSNYKMVATVGQYATRKGTANGKVLYSGFYAPRSTRSPKSGCTGVTEGLVACYPFDGNANDGSGNGNHGIASSGVKYTAGKVGQAVKLDRNSFGYLRVKNPTQKFDSQYTMTGWVSINGGGQQPIVSKYSWNPGTKGFILYSYNTELNALTGFNNETSAFGETAKYTIPLHKFLYMSAVYNDGHTKLFIDGILVSESTIQHPETLDNSYDMLIGAFFTNDGKKVYFRSFDGVIDNLRIYNRALSESEIKKLYDGTEEPCEPELSVEPLYRVLHWWQVQTPFELQNKTTCKMDWTTQANRLTVSPTSGTDDATLNAMMYPSWWFNVGTFTTTAPNAIGSPTHNLVIQPGLWWWWRYWVMQLISGRIHPNQAIPHIIAINRIMRGPMIFRVRWPGSDLDLKITTPSGQTLTQDSPEVLKVHEGDTEEYWLVESEETGDWQVEVVAIEVDVEGEDYQLEIVANERSEPPTEDTDGDGLPDEWETYFFGDLTQDGSADSDGDGVSNLREFQENLNPVNEDTDGDGKLDGDEITIAPASCQLYAVNDKGLNNSQFFTVSLDDFTVSALGPMYKGHDIEALAIHPETNMIYAASGDNVTNEKQGHFYRVDGENGELFPVGSSGFKEIEDLTFSTDGTLYAWAKGDGLITINLTTGVGTLELPYDKPLIEGLTLKKNEDKVFFGAVGTDLWQYDWETDTLDVICPDKLLGETEALEIMPEGLLLIGTHNVPFGLHAFNPETCQVIEAETTLSHQYNEVEGIALPVAACGK
jgi:hypothetical protein